MAVRTILSYGDSNFNRVQLFFFLALNFIPIIFKKYLRKCIDSIANKGLYVLVGKIKYFVVDEESLFIVNPMYERELRKWIMPKKNDVFVDVGAHVGKYALPFARIVEKVIALEPMPQNYNALRRAIEENKIHNVVSLNIAGWNKRGFAKLFVNSSGECSLKSSRAFGHIVVQTEKLDDILLRLQISHVDLVKIDVEGSELEVLEGMTESLNRYSPRMIIEIAEQNKSEVFSFMKKAGYDIFPVVDTPILAYYFAQRLSL